VSDSEYFYENLSSIYHLIFEDWEESIRQQGKIISKLLPPPDIANPVLDCACGIGTQALALASVGYTVEGTDLSPSEIERAKKEANIRKLSINFRVDDMRQLITAPLKKYGALINMDNSLPHLNSNEEIITTLTAMRNLLDFKCE
jgi:2-polyprenyl-3-methyl-5-hydroxy-6-metoxy-1,4-benzoquinol methylase